MRKEETKAIRAVMKIKVKGIRGRERLKKTLLDTFKNDIKAMGFRLGVVEDQGKGSRPQIVERKAKEN